MATEFGFIGWCNEDNHDKIWGYVYRPTPNASRWTNKQSGWNCAKFWAARGKAVQMQADTTGYELDKIVGTKRKKGYMAITEEKLFQVWPTFKEDMEGKLITEVLAGRIK
jgi:hypothetical protein